MQLSESRCVVLGAGGFIGTNLSRALNERVSSLKAFGRRQAFPDAMKGIPWITGDFSEPASVAAVLGDADIVFHLVNTSTPTSSNFDKMADLESSVRPTIAMLEACREAGVKRVVFVSSGGTVYGVPKHIPTFEDAPTWPITAYGVTKLAIEKYLFLFDHLYGLDFRVLRVANPFGAYQSTVKIHGAIMTFLQKAMDNRTIEIWGDGSTLRDYIYIDDVVSAIMAASEHGDGNKVFNIGAGAGRTLNDIIAAIEGLLGRSLSVKYLNPRPGDVPRSVLDISRAQAELQWSPAVTFEEGLRRTATWLESQRQ